MEKFPEEHAENSVTETPEDFLTEKPEKIHPLYTGSGDTGFTKDLFLNKIRKSSLLPELFVKMDRMQADIDKAITLLEYENHTEKEFLEVIQKRIWQTYAMIQDPENKLKYITSPITDQDIREIEDYIKNSEKFSSNSFLRFHNEKSQMLNDCRVSVRDAEISLHRYLEHPENVSKSVSEISSVIPAFFNRLSSLFFAMALKMEFES